MQFMIIPVLITSLIALLRGGRVQNLAHLHLKNSWIPLTMATLQFFIVLFPQWRGELFLRLRPWVTVSTYALLVAFLVVNRELSGMKLILVGAVLNLVVIASNGGYMPVTLEAIEQSGHLDKIIIEGEHAYVLGSKDIVLSEEQSHFTMLSDVLKMPDVIPTPATFSIGDVFIMVGAAWLLYRVLKDDPFEWHEPGLMAID